jgi:hypothetical protein
MKLSTTQRIGLAAMVIFGGLLISSLFIKRKPQVVLPPQLFTHNQRPLPLPPIPQPTVTQEEMEELRRKIEASSKPLPPQTVPAPSTPPPTPAPPPPPAFRASKPGADQFQPLPFPADVTEPYTQEGFKKNLEHALTACPMGAMELLSIDCAEFPCMALTALKDETARQANLNACPAWTDIYHHGTQYVGSTQKRDGQEIHYMSWVPLPPHDADAKLVMLRSTRRARAQVKAYVPR